MRETLFTIGSFKVHSYGTLIAIGFIVAMLVAEYRAKKNGLKEEAVVDIAIIAGVCGFLGAKILYVIVSFDEFLKQPLAVLGSSGFVVYGGIIGGVAAAYIYCRIKKLNFLDYFDLVMPEIAIAQGFGRIGCFLAGCCYGRETDSWFSVMFPDDCNFAPGSVPLIPTQLLSSAGDFLIAVILIIVAVKLKNKLQSGNIGELYMVLYGIGRFVIEFFRNDYRGAVGFMSTSQFISIFIIAFAVVLYFVNKKKNVA